MLISTPASYLVISSMFFRYRKEIGRVWRVSENTQEVIDNPVYLKTPVKAGIVAGTVISGIMICVYIFVGTARNPFDKVELLKVPEISAHRGSSGLAPENTMSAFKQALYDLADYVLGHFQGDEKKLMEYDSSMYAKAKEAQAAMAAIKEKQKEYDSLWGSDEGGDYDPEGVANNAQAEGDLPEIPEPEEIQAEETPVEDPTATEE